MSINASKTSKSPVFSRNQAMKNQFLQPKGVENVSNMSQPIRNIIINDQKHILDLYRSYRGHSRKGPWTPPLKTNSHMVYISSWRLWRLQVPGLSRAQPQGACEAGVQTSLGVPKKSWRASDKNAPPPFVGAQFHFWSFLSQMSVLKPSSEDFENIHTFQTSGKIHYILKDCYMWYSCTALLFWRNRSLLFTKQELPSESQHILRIAWICSVNQHIRFLIHKRVTHNDGQWQGSTLKIAYC